MHGSCSPMAGSVASGGKEPGRCRAAEKEESGGGCGRGVDDWKWVTARHGWPWVASWEGVEDDRIWPARQRREECSEASLRRGRWQRRPARREEAQPAAEEEEMLMGAVRSTVHEGWPAGGAGAVVPHVGRGWTVVEHRGIRRGLASDLDRARLSVDCKDWVLDDLGRRRSVTFSGGRSSASLLLFGVLVLPMCGWWVVIL
uniref:Uncharacterized protein n=1 Tax=Oryza nivara TaxID=4536 RepID=A0A0E0G5M5_ORYNI